VIKAVFRVTLPDELLQPLMQMIRDFDTKYDPEHEGKIHFESLIDSDWPVDRMTEVLNSIDPKPAYTYTGKLKKKPGEKS
jgi:hypothetical protein